MESWAGSVVLQCTVYNRFDRFGAECEWRSTSRTRKRDVKLTKNMRLLSPFLPLSLCTYRVYQYSLIALKVDCHAELFLWTTLPVIKSLFKWQFACRGNYDFLGDNFFLRKKNIFFYKQNFFSHNFFYFFTQKKIIFIWIRHERIKNHPSEYT